MLSPRFDDRLTNLLGRSPEALEVADSPTGRSYPVGAVIQLIPNEAMIKRAPGWSPETNDWEPFSLETSAAGTEILDRGCAPLPIDAATIEALAGW